MQAQNTREGKKVLSFFFVLVTPYFPPLLALSCRLICSQTSLMGTSHGQGYNLPYPTRSEIKKNLLGMVHMLHKMLPPHSQVYGLHPDVDRKSTKQQQWVNELTNIKQNQTYL